MKSFGVCFLFTCYLTIIIITESVQEKNIHTYSDAIMKNLALYCHAPYYTDGGGVLVQNKPQFADLPQSAKGRSRAFVNVGEKRGNQFKNFMLGRDTSKEVVSRVQKGSYIPVKSNGKRDDSQFSPVYGIYTGTDDRDIFQKWLSSYYLQ
ncbi:uncharacterized protein LOC112687440 isoform X2 [Sipha flava]|uniref:Uncharacterized protein LOC112687440 isoform X2 n=1 Tax=Sipha flava TaxID=143950 RepID=A0A8B8FY94_9HEMI|nr:uncharacterized protein LOC112687440 isoform X2 [Sipha flava]